MNKNVNNFVIISGIAYENSRGIHKDKQKIEEFLARS